MLKVEDQFKRFSNHILTGVFKSDKIKVFSYANPASINNSQRWIIDGTTLVVLGDNGSAVYRWQGSICLEFLAGCDLYYFSSKCEADKDGSRQEVFDAEYAQKYLLEVAVDRVIDSCDKDFDGQDIDSMSVEDKFELVRDIFEKELDDSNIDVDSLFYFDNAQQAYDTLSSREYEFCFGSDGWEYGSCLVVKTITPYIHLAALRSAYQKYGNAF